MAMNSNSTTERQATNIYVNEKKNANSNFSDSFHLNVQPFSNCHTEHGVASSYCHVVTNNRRLWKRHSDEKSKRAEYW